MPEQPNEQITFYTTSNIPLPALTSLAVTQELQDELLIRRLNLAFNRGIEHERKLTNMPMNEASHAACKMVKEDKPEQQEWYSLDEAEIITDEIMPLNWATERQTAIREMQKRLNVAFNKGRQRAIDEFRIQPKAAEDSEESTQ